MSANLFNEPPPQNQPPLNPDGSINPIWFLWFYNLFQASSALVDLQILESFDGGLSDQSLSAAERAEALQAAAIETGAKPSRGNIEAALIEQPRDWRKPIQDGTVLAWTSAGDPKRVVYIGTAALRAITPAVFGAVFFETDTQFFYVAVKGLWIVVVGSSATPGAWTPYAPAITPAGAMTYVATSSNCFYQQNGKLVYVRGELVGTLGGTPARVLSIALPVTARDIYQTLAGFLIDSGNFRIAGAVAFGSTSNIDFYNGLGVVFTLGLTTFTFEGVYEAA